MVVDIDQDKGTKDMTITPEPQLETPPTPTEAPIVVPTPTTPPVTPPEPAQAPAPTKDWRDARIAQMTARLAKIESAKAPTPTLSATPGTPAPSSVQDDFNARVSAAVSAQVAQNEFDRKCVDVVAQGNKEFGGDFDVAIANLQKLVDVGDQRAVSHYMLFVETAIDTGVGAKLLYELGKDLNKAMGLLAQTPTRMAVELTKMAVAEGVTAEPSKAPKPITPVGDSGRSHEPIDPTDKDRSDKLSTRDWMERREAALAKQAGKRS